MVCSALPSRAQTQTCYTFATAAPINVIFGPQALATTSATQTVTFTVSTTCASGSVTLTSFSIGTDASEFGALSNGTSPCTNLPLTLTANSGAPASCTVATEFTPSATGTRIGSLVFNYTGAPTPTTTVNLVGGDEIVYVSTQYGGQILKVDGIIAGYAQVVYDGSAGPNGTDLNSGSGFFPEGLTVGPDSRLYIADPLYSDIWRLNLDGTDMQPVYQKFGSTSFPNFPSCNSIPNAYCPEAPQGPSFSGGPSFITNSGNGDLYFSSGLINSEGVFTMPNVASTSDAGLASLALPPTNVDPGSCGTCTGPYPVGGAATAFDSTGNLLAADNENNRVISLSSPYNASSSPPTQLITVSGEPLGLALNKLTGQMFLSDSASRNIQAINSNGTTSVYYAFSSNTTCVQSETTGADQPMFMQFDAQGRLFVVTTTSMVANGGNGCGKVWRIDPPGSGPICIESAMPCPLVLVDLNQAQTGGIEGICTAPCGLNSPQAIGLALPPTLGTTQSVSLMPGGGTATLGWPPSCTPSNTPGNNCSSTIGIQYPAGMFGNGDTLNVAFNETTQAQFMANAAGTPYAMTTLAPVSGYNGGGLVPTLTCTNGGTACSDINTSSIYNIFTTWQSIQTNYCSLIPHLLKGDPPGGPYNQLLVDTIVSCTDGGVGTKGQSSCTSTSSSSCLSDWPNATGPTTGPTAATKVTASIASPSNGAVFSLNGPAATTFSCTPAANPPVVSCLGSVTQPDGTIVSVSSGNPLPTSQAGNYTLTVSASVDGGAPPPTSTLTATAKYAVSSLQFIGFAAPVNNPMTLNVAKGGQTIPVKFQVLDANGNPVTNLTMPPVSIGFASENCMDLSTTASDPVPTTVTGGSAFQNLGGGNYQYNWKTTGLKGCGQLQVSLGDRLIHVADFQFK